MARATGAAAEVGWLILLAVLPAILNPAGMLAVEPAKASLLRVTAALIGAAWAASRLLDRGPRVDVLAIPIVRAGLLFLLANALATLLSLEPSLSFFGTYQREMGLLTLAAGAVLLLTGADLLADDRRRQRAVTALLVGAVAPCAYALLQEIGRDPLGWTGVVGTVSTFGSPTFFAGYLVLVLPFALLSVVQLGRAVADRSAPGPSVAYLGSLALTLLAGVLLVLLGVRAALVGLLVEVLVFAFLAARGGWAGKRRWWVAGTLLLLAAMALLVGLADRGDLPAVRRFGEIFSPSGSAAQRLGLWMGSIELLLRDPGRLLVGFGPETQAAIFEQSRRVIQLSANERFDRAHNVLLDTWLTGGLVSVAALGILLITALRTGWATYRSARGAKSLLAAALLAALAGHLAEQAFSFQTVTTGALFWVVLGFLASLDPRARPAPPSTQSPGRRAWLVAWTGLAAAMLTVPVLASPGVADALAGASHRAGGGQQAALLAESGSAWAPWVEELPRQAGVTWQSIGLGRPGLGEESQLRRAEADFIRAADRAPYDPYAQARLARHEIAWARRRPAAEVQQLLLSRAETACQRAEAVGPYRFITHQVCDEVRLAQRDLG